MVTDGMLVAGKVRPPSAGPVPACAPAGTSSWCPCSTPLHPTPYLHRQSHMAATWYPPPAHQAAKEQRKAVHEVLGRLVCQARIGHLEAREERFARACIEGARWG